MDYDVTEGGVDNMDKLVTAYSCKRRTLHWPLVIFFDILDISAYNANGKGIGETSNLENTIMSQEPQALQPS